MPIRMIREDILTSEAVNSLSFAEEVFYRRVMSKADDLGLYDARPRTLKMELYGYKDDVTAEDCSQWLDACVRAGLIRTYEHEGKPYLHIEKFRQRLRRMSIKHPLPSWITRFETRGDDGKVKVEYTWRTRDGHVEDTRQTRDGHVTAEEKRKEGKGREENLINGGVSKATLYGENSAELAPAPESEKPAEYLRWLAIMRCAHPRARLSRKLKPAVEAAAFAAWERYPEAEQKAELLEAYFADVRTTENRRGVKFWRPNGQELYFDNLEDIVGYAEMWDREVGWSKKLGKGAQKHEKASYGACNISCGQPATHEETKAMLDEMKAELGLGEGGSHV